MLDVQDCPSMDYYFPCGLWPPHLSTLLIGGLKKPMSEWGLQNFPTSLVSLLLYGQNSGVVSFSLFVPPSLTHLGVGCFMELESVSKGLQHLTCLQQLSFKSCPKLKDLPAETILLLLSSLHVDNCPKLEKRCDSKKGKYWPIISQIPYLHVGRSQGLG
ncbi:putative disease resistance protein RGA4 [Cynara cardunculus var. scolymus]|uniref:putative disease resistance protein RGA4 n=1 Tax=Cynara cardunculus var. scolymus TaxID=59895 RepID=UPI000D630F78|nr:putative disease resistance protein RGA4 [Cynara cardunculus var. scolymus]